MADPRDTMQALAVGLSAALNGNERPGPNGFVLLVFPMEGPEGQRTNYVSNCERKDILAALKEIVARFEGQPHQRGNA